MSLWGGAASSPPVCAQTEGRPDQLFAPRRIPRKGCERNGIPTSCYGRDCVERPRAARGATASGAGPARDGPMFLIQSSLLSGLSTWAYSREPGGGRDGAVVVPPVRDYARTL